MVISKSLLEVESDGKVLMKQHHVPFLWRAMSGGVFWVIQPNGVVLTLHYGWSVSRYEAARLCWGGLCLVFDALTYNLCQVCTREPLSFDSLQWCSVCYLLPAILPSLSDLIKWTGSPPRKRSPDYPPPRWIPGCCSGARIRIWLFIQLQHWES